MVLRLVSPLLVESDLVSLSTELVVEDGLLIDKTLGARHELSAVAREAIMQIETSLRFDRWATSMTALGLSGAQQTEIVQFLNHIGGLRVTRSWSARLEIFITRLQVALVGGKSAAVSWRRCASPSALVVATLRAMTGLASLSLIAAVLCWGTGLSSLVDAIQVLSGGLLIIWASTLAHEFTHVAITSATGKQGAVMQQGMRLGILHPPLSTPAELASTLTGPLVGAAVAICGAVMFSALGLSPLLSWVGMAVAGFHGLSILPWYGDGLSLWKLTGGRIA